MITIVGGGPSGCNAAWLLSKKGYKVNLLEEHKKIGLPVQCTGIVTENISSIKGMKNVIKDSTINSINDARIIIDNHIIDIYMKKADLIIDRHAFDSALAEKAESEGTTIYNSERYLSNTKKAVNTSKRTITSNDLKLIGADGPLSDVAKKNNLGNIKNRKFWFGHQARVKLKNDNVIEFYPKIGTFAWVVPEDENYARIGIATTENSKKEFQKFINSKIKNKKDILEFQGGLIPKYDPEAKTSKNNVFLLGDAASQVKATTGGGIIPGMKAAESLASSIEKGDNYEKAWKKNIGKDLWLHLKMRDSLDKFKEKDWDSLANTFQKDKNKKILSDFDRDNPKKILPRLLLREPKLAIFARYLL